RFLKSAAGGVGQSANCVPQMFFSVVVLEPSRRQKRDILAVSTPPTCQSVLGSVCLFFLLGITRAPCSALPNTGKYTGMMHVHNLRPQALPSVHPIRRSRKY
ncbi:unnamed protein product, partial [Ectocarpus sp. 12 AP-2014]